MSLTQLILYGMGTTMGAGIYALIGEIARTTGYLAPWSFLLATFLALLTALSFARLSSLYPQTAGIALYVQTGFRSSHIARIAGLLAIAAGLVSSAALLNGFIGYLQVFCPVPAHLAIALVSLIVCLVACWGIKESVWLAGFITLLEVGGLLWVTWLAGTHVLQSSANLSLFFPADFWSGWSIILSGAVLAFYAYIGFEDMVEVAEEVVDVKRNMPRGILIVLAVSSALYLLLITSALLATGPTFLGASKAQLADLLTELGTGHPGTIAIIGMLAIVNGIFIQVVMASRVLFGLARRGQLPITLAEVHPRTQTPIQATVFASVVVTILSLSATIATLAELTSLIILTLFAGVNASLLKIEFSKPPMERHFPLIVTSTLGTTFCVSLLAHSLMS